MARHARPPDPVPHPDVAAGGIRRTRHYMLCFIDSLRECGHEPQHVKQVMRELLYAAAAVRQGLPEPAHNSVNPDPLKTKVVSDLWAAANREPISPTLAAITQAIQFIDGEAPSDDDRFSAPLQDEPKCDKGTPVIDPPSISDIRDRGGETVALPDGGQR